MRYAAVRVSLLASALAFVIAPTWADDEIVPIDGDIIEEVAPADGGDVDVVQDDVVEDIGDGGDVVDGGEVIDGGEVVDAGDGGDVVVTDAVEGEVVDFGDCGEACMFYSMGGEAPPEVLRGETADFDGEPAVSVDVGAAGGIANFLEQSAEMTVDGETGAAASAVALEAAPAVDVALDAPRGGVIRGGHLR